MADQHAFWNGPVSAKWRARSENFERAFAPMHAALMDFAAIRAGEHVLDVGCGVGDTTAAVAAAAAPGKTVGIDISEPLIATARERSAPVTFIAADATDYPFSPEFDLVISQLGLMFFERPEAAFANLRTALKPGGRLAFVCWCRVEDVPAFRLPFEAARDLLPPGDPSPPGKPGPFGLADDARIRELLNGAGWKNVTIERTTPPVDLGDTLEEAVEQALHMGPLYRASRHLDDAVKDDIRSRLVPVLAPYRSAEGVRVPAAFWLVRALA